MIQIVVPGTLPKWSLVRLRCLTDPDSLLDIEQKARLGSSVEELSERFSLVLHDLRMGGTWKRTNRGRLKQTEKMLCKHTLPELRREFTLLDVGASDGITTVEAVRALRRAFGVDVRAVVADRDIWLFRYRRGPIVEYRAMDGEPIMARIGPFGARLAKHRRDEQPEGGAFARRYLQLIRFRNLMEPDARISLVNPASRSEPGITVLQLDCLVRDDSLVGGISAIRASNVLNPGYFSPPQIEEAVGHFSSYLKEGGCLVVSRNADLPEGEAENGSVWRKDGQRFRWIDDFGSGSEIRSIIDSWSP